MTRVMSLISRASTGFACNNWLSHSWTLVTKASVSGQPTKCTDMI